jgi:hypothetical protein
MKTREDLQKFMETHVYAVWDFMCLLKSIDYYSRAQSQPTMWSPPLNLSYNALRLINEIYLCEETDILPDGNYSSHLEIYLKAMEEVGADTSKFREFLVSKDINTIPQPARAFVENTFEMINTGKLHVVVSSFTYGREMIIPEMFTKILDELEIDAPMFRYYLQRHIEVDGDEHGPQSERLINEVIGNDPIKKQEVEQAKYKSIEARNRLWIELGL